MAIFDQNRKNVTLCPKSKNGRVLDKNPKWKFLGQKSKNGHFWPKLASFKFRKTVKFSILPTSKVLHFFQI